MVHTCNRYNKSFKKLWMLTQHVQNRNFLCRPQVIPTTNPISIPQIDSETGDDTKRQISDSSLDQVSDSSGLSNKVNLNTEYPASQTKTEPQEIIIS